MPRKFDFDCILQDFHTLTPSQRDAAVRLIIREAQAERAAVFARSLRAFGTWSWKAAVRGFGGMRRLSAPVLGLMTAGWQRYRRARQRRLTAARLLAMDDRMLKDIGLNRGDIDFVLSGADDPTRVPRPASRVRDRLGTLQTLRPAARLRTKPPSQRAERPLVARNACAG